MLRQKIQVHKSMKLYCYCEIPVATYIWIGVVQKMFCHAMSLEFPEAEIYHCPERAELVVVTSELTSSHGQVSTYAVSSPTTVSVGARHYSNCTQSFEGVSVSNLCRCHV